MQSPRPHPHFDDRGTLDWHTRFTEALTAAKAEKKQVLIEFGRELCSQCRALVQGVMPHPDIAPLLKKGFVALASDCDEPEDVVLQLASRLQDANMLPFVIFTDADGNFIEGQSGPVNPLSFKKTLERVARSRRAQA